MIVFRDRMDDFIESIRKAFEMEEIRKLADKLRAEVDKIVAIMTAAKAAAKDAMRRMRERRAWPERLERAVVYRPLPVPWVASLRAFS